MILTRSLRLLSLLSITANALPAPSSSSAYSSIFNSFIQNIDLTNCPLDSITLPTSTLPSPSEGLTLKSIVLGRGTQNYTCTDNTADSIPNATGATATLFDASCLAALEKDTTSKDAGDSHSLLHLLPDILKPIPLSNADFLANLLNRVTGQDLVVGKHYFNAEGVPFFDLKDGQGFDGNSWVAAEKDSDADAPVKPGYGVSGDVAWLKLSGVDGGYKEVYRVHTAGGSPPESCEREDEEFTVDYTAEYWFYA